MKRTETFMRQGGYLPCHPRRRSPWNFACGVVSRRCCTGWLKKV